MKRTTKNALATIFAGLFAIGSTFAAGTTAVATQSAMDLPAETIPDRTIYVDHAAPPLSENVQVDPELSTQQVKVRVGEIKGLPLIPEDGETVRIVYTDAVSDVTRAAACTKSLTAYTPYLSGGNVWVNGGWSISTGCTSGDTATVWLVSGFSTLASNSFTATPTGWNSTGGVAKACKNTNSRNYYGMTSWGSGGSTKGNLVSLKCAT